MVSLSASLRKAGWHSVLLVLILALGVFARVWEFGSLPPGLNQDEASNGVDAMSLYRYGTDRAGVSFPMRFISWGSGQDALYGYVLVPLIAVAGLSPRVVRLPMLIAGLLTLPLLYFLGRRLRGKAFALLATFLLAISPWHVVASRWALEPNLLPFVFLLGFTCLVLSDAGNHWFIPASIFFGLGLYCYITSYLAIPLFLLLALPWTHAAKRISIRDLTTGLLIFAILAMPAALYVIVNSFNLASIHIGPLTIPHLPSVSRIETDVGIFQSAPLEQLGLGILRFLTFLVRQNDGEYNQPGFGYLYNVTFPLIAAGGLLFFLRKDEAKHRRLVLAWLIAAAAVGVLITPVFVHNNLIFIPLIMFCAAFLEWLMHWNRAIFVVSVGAFLVAFVMFTAYYHGPAYKEQADREYFTGLLSAFDYARTSSNDPICVTTPKIIMPYIFALFSEKMAPSVGPEKIVYANPDAQFRHVTSVGRYFFGPENCPADGPVTYIQFFNELPPAPGREFTTRQFGLYKVNLPR